jgi:hypothetical protein
MKVHLPSIAALTAGDDRLLHRELGGLAVRRQSAVVRALLDQLERVSPWSASDGLRAQLLEELARLGCVRLEAAASLSSGFAVPPLNTRQVKEELKLPELAVVVAPIIVGHPRTTLPVVPRLQPRISAWIR